MIRVCLIPAVLILVQASTTFSQSVKIGLGAGGGIAIGTDLAVRDISDGGDGFRFSYGPSATVKFSTPALPVTFASQFSYEFMQASGNNNSPIGEFGGEVHTKGTLFSVDLGAELPLGQAPATPYLGVYLLLNSFGRMTYDLDTPFFGSYEFVWPGKTTVGAGIGAGLEVSLSKQIDLDFSAKFRLRTLSGKVDGVSDFNTLDVNASILFNFL